MPSNIKSGSHKIKNVAFVWTEFQQKILNAILLQDEKKVDVLFIRKGVAEFPNLMSLCKRVVYLSNIACSYKNSRLLRREIENNIKPYLTEDGIFIVYSWTVGHPYVRSTVFEGGCQELNLFEDGTGSYVDCGWYNHKLGVKTFLSTLALHTSLIELGGFKRYPKRLPIYGWSLFPGAYPRIPTRRKQLCHGKYRESISFEDNSPGDLDINIPDESVVYIPSPYADSHLVSDNDEVKFHSEALKLLFSRKYISNDKVVFWKSHPRANLSKERERIKQIEKKSGCVVKVLENCVGMESFALENRNVELSFFSLASSALYGISALGIEKHKVHAVKVRSLTDRLPNIASLYSFFEKADIKIIE